AGDETVPEAYGWFGDGPARGHQAGEPHLGNLAQDAGGIIRQPACELRPALPVGRPTRLEIIGAVKDSTHRFPLRQSNRVIAHRVEDAAVGLALGLGAGRAGGAVEQLVGTRARAGPAAELLLGRVAEGVVQPDGAEP